MTAASSKSGTMHISRFGFWVGVAVVLALADQVTKWAVIEWLTYIEGDQILYRTAKIYDPVITILLQKNPGAAWGFLADQSGWQRYFFIVLASGVSLAIVVWLYRIRAEGPLILQAGLAFVLGGAVGNLVDRIRSGEVTDFIQIKFAGMPGFDPFPSFNVADAAITVGAALLIVDALFYSGRTGQATAEKE
jgi:signal peptidase II